MSALAVVFLFRSHRPMGSIKLNTMEDAAQWQGDLVVSCEQCGHEARFHAAQTARYFRSRQWPTSLGSAANRFRCEQCGSRKCVINVALPKPVTPRPVPRPKSDDPAPLGVDQTAWAQADMYERKRLIRQARD